MDCDGYKDNKKLKGRFLHKSEYYRGYGQYDENLQV